MNLLRTPDSRFDALPGFDFAPHYAEVPCGDGSGSLRVHYLDEGPASGAEKILLLHGEPSWCYLYRKMIGPAHERRLPGHRAGPGGLRSLRQAGQSR